MRWEVFEDVFLSMGRVERDGLFALWYGQAESRTQSVESQGKNIDFVGVLFGKRWRIAGDEAFSAQNKTSEV